MLSILIGDAGQRRLELRDIDRVRRGSAPRSPRPSPASAVSRIDIEPVEIDRLGLRLQRRAAAVPSDRRLAGMADAEQRLRLPRGRLAGIGTAARVGDAPAEIGEMAGCTCRLARSGNLRIEKQLAAELGQGGIFDRAAAVAADNRASWQRYRPRACAIDCACCERASAMPASVARMAILPRLEQVWQQTIARPRERSSCASCDAVRIAMTVSE